MEALKRDRGKTLATLQKIGADWKVNAHVWNHDKAPAQFRDDARRGYSRTDCRNSDRTREADGDEEYQRPERYDWRSGVTSAVTEIRDAMTIARGSTNGMSVAIGIAIESEAGS